LATTEAKLDEVKKEYAKFVVDAPVGVDLKAVPVDSNRDPVVITGKVVNERGRPVTDADIRVFRDANAREPLAQSTTDKNGQFSFKTPPNAAVVVRVTDSRGAWVKKVQAISSASVTIVIPSRRLQVFEQ
jgi:uncharacterized GH25 family protein